MKGKENKYLVAKNIMCPKINHTNYTEEKNEIISWYIRNIEQEAYLYAERYIVGKQMKTENNIPGESD